MGRKTTSYPWGGETSSYVKHCLCSQALQLHAATIKATRNTDVGEEKKPAEIMDISVKHTPF